MSDNFERHVARLKAEKGTVWASEFDEEFTYFKLCHLMTMGRELSGMSRAAVSSASGVPERIIAKIEREEADVAPEHFDALTAWRIRCIIK